LSAWTRQTAATTQVGVKTASCTRVHLLLQMQQPAPAG
jgi:hypothetical protein